MSAVPTHRLGTLIPDFFESFLGFYVGLFKSLFVSLLARAARLVAHCGAAFLSRSVDITLSRAETSRDAHRRRKEPMTCVWNRIQDPGNQLQRELGGVGGAFGGAREGSAGGLSRALGSG